MTKPHALVLSGSFALALASTPRAAFADPIALRSVDTGNAVHLALGYPDSSIGAWIAPHLGVSFEWRPPVALGASLATRFTLIGRPRGVGLDAFGAAGLMLLRYDPGAAVTATLALQLRYRSESFWLALGVASPMAFQFVDTADARFPLMLELAMQVHAGRVWIGAQGGAGLVFVPGLSPSLALQAALLATIPWDS